jgi:hypothetical protein
VAYVDGVAAHVLSVRVGDWTPAGTPITYSYQWQRCPTSAVAALLSECADV